MKLRGQEGAERGYAMAVLLVGLSVAAILMSAAMPAWRQMMRREKEAELVFRGEQYARAIGLARGGSMEPMLISSCLAEMSGKRAEELRQLSEGF